MRLAPLNIVGAHGIFVAGNGEFVCDVRVREGDPVTATGARPRRRPGQGCARGRAWSRFRGRTAYRCSDGAAPCAASSERVPTDAIVVPTEERGDVPAGKLLGLGAAADGDRHGQRPVDALGVVVRRHGEPTIRREPYPGRLSRYTGASSVGVSQLVADAPRPHRRADRITPPARHMRYCGSPFCSPPPGQQTREPTSRTLTPAPPRGPPPQDLALVSCKTPDPRIRYTNPGTLLGLSESSS